MKKKQPDLIEKVVFGILNGLWFLVSWPFRKWQMANRKSPIDKVANLQKWLEIEKMLETNDEIHAKQAVIEADKFFDNTMKQFGANGQTFADRLRSIEAKMNQARYQQVWQAHKVRNQISHEMEYHLSCFDAKNVLDDFREGLNNLGAL